MSDGKQATSMRLSEEARRLLDDLARRQGITRSAVMELAIREYARSQGVRARQEEDEG